MNNILDKNTFLASANDMHFALLNASRGNTKAQDDVHKKKVVPAAQVASAKPTDNAQETTNASTSGDQTSSDASNGSNPSTDDNSDLPPGMSGTLQKEIHWLQNATVETSNFVLIMMGWMLLLGVATQNLQLNDIANITSIAQRITNEFTKVMGFFSTLENAAGTQGLPSSFFSGQTLQDLEQACQAMADIFMSNPANQPLSSYGVYYQGVVYVPVIVSGNGNGTPPYSVEWVNVNDPPSDLQPRALSEISGPASDLQVLLCGMFQYEADIHTDPKNPDSGPSASKLQQQVDQSLSAITTLIGFGSGSQGKQGAGQGNSIITYMCLIGLAVNANEKGSVFSVIPAKSIDKDLGSIYGSTNMFDGFMTGFEHQLNSWAIGYAKNNDPADSKAYQQGSNLDQFYKYLTNVQNNASTKVQGAMSVSKKKESILSSDVQIVQSSVKDWAQAAYQMVQNQKAS